jgi:hypothetical protein
MRFIEQLFGALIFAALLSRFLRWAITKGRKRAPGLIAPHILSFIGAIIMAVLLSADGPFVNAGANGLNAVMLYVPAQLICLLYDWTRSRRFAAAGVK